MINSRRSVVDCRPHLPRLLSPPSAVNSSSIGVAVYVSLVDGRYAVAKLYSLGQSLSSEMP